MKEVKKEGIIKAILERKVYECDDYVICVEARKKPLNYEIYIKTEKSRHGINPTNVFYSDFSLGVNWAIELADDHIKNYGKICK